MKIQDGFKMDMTEFRGSVIAQLADIKGDIGKLDSKLTAYICTNDKRIGVLELWKADLMAKVTLVIAVLTIIINLSWDTLRERLGFK